MEKIKTKTLYEHFKNSPKKLKIICDWDEVIQACEPYASFKTIKNEEEYIKKGFKDYFEWFWKEKDIVKYSPYASVLNPSMFSKRSTEKQTQIKNFPNFYQQAPFLTIGEDLLKLIKEDKVSRLIFLSAYGKRKYPYGDERKLDIFTETFDQLCLQDGSVVRGFSFRGEGIATTGKLPICSLQLIPFDSEEKGQSKADYIKKNASDFDLVIDDNPNICNDLIKESVYFNIDMEIFAPYYPVIENQHNKEVLLVKNEVSNLKKEDFSK